MFQSRQIRVMVADDHPVVRDGIREVLNHFDEFNVVGLAANGDEAVRLAAELRPDVVVMDVIMPVKDGVDACREIMDLMTETRVLMLTASTAPGAVIEAIAAGASGYLLKDSGVDRLVEGIRDVSQGRVNLTAEALRRAAIMIRRDSVLSRTRGPDMLTPKETAMLRQFCRGLSYTQIADSDGISRSTVRNTIHRVQDKVGVDSKQEMVIWAARNGLLDDLDLIVETSELTARPSETETTEPTTAETEEGTALVGPCR